MKMNKWMLLTAAMACVTTFVVAQETPQRVRKTQPWPDQGVDIAAPRVDFPWQEVPPVGQDKGGVDISGDYEVVRGWPVPPHADYTWGRVGAVWAESPNRVFVFQEGELPVLEKPIGYASLPTRRASRPGTGPMGKVRWEHLLTVFDANGKMVEAWEQWNDKFMHPHSVMISPYDPEKHVWLIDSSANVIYKFTNDGKKLVMTMGEFKVAGMDQTHFGGPTDIAFLPNGDFWVSDGYNNGRVAKFNKDGKYITEFGKPGKGNGEFYVAHSVAVDAQGRLYVADRANARVQVFDANGKFLQVWPNIPFPMSVVVSRDQHVWVSDGFSHRILKYDTNGKLLYSWGTFGQFPGTLWGVHRFTTDSEGNVYTAEVYGGRTQKFRPKKGADPAHLVGSLYGYK